MVIPDQTALPAHQLTLGRFDSGAAFVDGFIFEVIANAGAVSGMAVQTLAVSANVASLSSRHRNI
jgi:hypothetical protein